MINHVNILSNLSLVFPQFPFLMSAIILVFDYKVIALDAIFLRSTLLRFVCMKSAIQIKSDG